MSASKPGEGLDETTPPDVVLKTPGGVEERLYMGRDSGCQTAFDGLETIFHIRAASLTMLPDCHAFQGCPTLRVLI